MHLKYKPDSLAKARSVRSAQAREAYAAKRAAWLAKPDEERQAILKANAEIRAKGRKAAEQYMKAQGNYHNAVFLRDRAQQRLDMMERIVMRRLIQIGDDWTDELPKLKEALRVADECLSVASERARALGIQ